MSRPEYNELRTDVQYKLEDFDIRKKIGKGQFSCCYKVRLKATGQPFALKRIQAGLTLSNFAISVFRWT